MATAETVDLGPEHPPKEDSISAFTVVLPELKHELIRLRKDYSSEVTAIATAMRKLMRTHPEHEPEYFAAVEHLSDSDLTGFNIDDLSTVRAAISAYGVHLFGKIRIPALADSGPSFIHARVFVGGGDEGPKLHSIHTEEKDEPDGGKTYRAIYTKDDPLEWFDT